MRFKVLITSTPDTLLFGADETMVNPKVHKRVVVPVFLQKTRIRPYSVDVLLENPYVRKLNQAEQVQYDRRQNYAARRFMCR